MVSAMARKVEVDFKVIIGIIALVIIATAGSAYSTYLIFQRGNTGMEATEAANVQKRDIGPIFEAGEFTVNLMTAGMQPRFIRTEIMVEGSSTNVVTELERRTPQIRDLIISLLRLTTAEELRTTDGVDILRTQIIEKINSLLLQGHVVDVYFVDLVIQ
jgi:flagellar basal body-associated protein FliL